MLENILNFFMNNWDKLLPALVGGAAIYVYLLQEYRKKKDAAALIISQIDSLQDKIRKMQPYILEQGINEQAFYESLPIIKVNYWEKYKHIFITKLDSKSCKTFDDFYQYVEIIQEQQNLAKVLIRDSFLLRQRILNETEAKYICETFNELGLNTLIATPEQINLFWQYFNIRYESKRQYFISAINNKKITNYVPVQVVETLKSILKQYSLLEVVAQEGYRELSNLAGITKTKWRIFTFFRWIL